MDPVTQGLLGAAVGQAAFGPKLGRRAALWGGLVGMSPDLDIVLNATGPLGEFLWHRGPTHSLFFGPVVGPLVGWLLWRAGKERIGSLADWIWLCVLALVTHPLLDLFTTYGTQLLGTAFDAKAKAMAGRALLSARVEPVRVESHPTVFQPWLRRLVVKTETGWGMGWASL